MNKLLPKCQILNLSLYDTFNCDLYVNRAFSNIDKLRPQKGVQKLYRLSGAAGEGIRHRWQMTPREFIKRTNLNANSYSYNLVRELTASIKNLVEFGLHSVCNKHQIKDAESVDIPQLFYCETRSRFHFGRDTLCNYLLNNVLLTPAIDSEVRTLHLHTKECPDYNLLIALLFTRFAPDLLNFPFDLNRSISPETVAYAQKLNERFPRRTATDKIAAKKFHLQPRDTRAEKILASGRKNPNIPRDLPEACLKAMFESGKTYGLFTSYFDSEFYRYAASYYDTHIFGRTRPIYAITGVAQVLEDVAISQRNYPPYQDVKRYLEQDFYLINDYENNAAQIIKEFNGYFTARIQFQLWQKNAKDSLKVVSISDDKAKLSSPGWYKKNGVGYVITSYVGKLKIVAKTLEEGQIRLNLLGLDIRNPDDNSKRIPYWIYYTKLVVNGKTILNEITPTWHDKPYLYKTDVKAGEEITIEVEWIPHRNDT